MYAVSIMLCVAASIGCKSVSGPAGVGPDEFQMKGTVVYEEIEGGFFAIHGEDGQTYNPVDLPDAFRKDGMEVQFRARPSRDALSFHMYGTTVEIVEIKRR
jgi:hypothetical protein